jgi:hypothetical protein
MTAHGQLRMIDEGNLSPANVERGKRGGGFVQAE